MLPQWGSGAVLCHPRVWERLFPEGGRERTGAAPHQLCRKERGATVGFWGGQGEVPAWGVSQQIRAPGRGAAPADPNTGTDGVKQLLWGHSWAGAKAWGDAKAEMKVQLILEKPLGFLSS